MSCLCIQLIAWYSESISDSHRLTEIIILKIKLYAECTPVKLEHFATRNPRNLFNSLHGSFALNLFVLKNNTGLLSLTLLSLQTPIGDCLLQHHKCWSATCRQNATVAIQATRSKRVTYLIFCVGNKSQSHCLSHDKKVFLQTPSMCFLCFAVFWTIFLQNF